MQKGYGFFVQRVYCQAKEQKPECLKINNARANKATKLDVKKG
jgi:hypothetical protein